MVNFEEQVAINERIEAMANEEGGAASHKAVHGLRDIGFGFRVEGAGRLVEDEDGRVLEKGASERDTLALAAGNQRATFAEFRIVAARKAKAVVTLMASPKAPFA